MASRASNYCLDAHDPYAQTIWWAQVLEDFQPHPASDQEPGDEECGLQGPADRWLLFLKVPEPKTVKNRMHLCLRPTDRTRDEEVDRILALGATLVDDRREGPDRGWAVLADPEGNEFCVLTPYRPGESTGLADAKQTLVDYLQGARDAMLWKLDGLSDHDVRRPLTPTGTNLLGLVKHLATWELTYFGDGFGRPSPVALPWLARAQRAKGADLYAAATQSREEVVDLYRTAWAHSAGTFATHDLDSVGHVELWRDRGTVTLHQMLVHVTAETQRHAGHADVLRELLDGSVGRRPGELDPLYGPEQHARVAAAAAAALGS